MLSLYGSITTQSFDTDTTNIWLRFLRQKFIEFIYEYSVLINSISNLSLLASYSSVTN